MDSIEVRPTFESIVKGIWKTYPFSGMAKLISYNSSSGKLIVHWSASFLIWRTLWCATIENYWLETELRTRWFGQHRVLLSHTHTPPVSPTALYLSTWFCLSLPPPVEAVKYCSLFSENFVSYWGILRKQSRYIFCTAEIYVYIYTSNEIYLLVTIPNCDVMRKMLAKNVEISFKNTILKTLTRKKNLGHS